MDSPSVDFAKVRAAIARAERIRAAGLRIEQNRQHHLARVNGWGSAGQCPASHSAKTPAVRESARRVAALARKGREDLAGANAQRPDPVGVSS